MADWYAAESTTSTVPADLVSLSVGADEGEGAIAVVFHDLTVGGAEVRIRVTPSSDLDKRQKSDHPKLVADMGKVAKAAIDAADKTPDGIDSLVVAESEGLAVVTVILNGLTAGTAKVKGRVNSSQGLAAREKSNRRQLVADMTKLAKDEIDAAVKALRD